MPGFVSTGRPPDSSSGSPVNRESFEAAFESRKRGHIRHALDAVNQASGLSGLDGIRLVHEALPDLDLEEVALAEACLGKRLATPFFVAGMTAGHPDAPAINLLLAECCRERGWALGLGSQRRELDALVSSDGALQTGGESGKPVGPDRWDRLKALAPELLIFSNIGISQLRGGTPESLRGLVDAVGAHALVVHLNALQESLQPEGTPQFRGAARALGEVCEAFRAFGIPVVVKETGCGFSEATLRRVASLGVAAVDVSGLGGTHWGRVEGARAGELSGAESLARAAETFASWGLSTVASVRAAAKALPSEIEIWASGGVRSGLDAAKLIALGATRVGYAKPALEAALAGKQALLDWMRQQELELRIALFCTSSASPAELRSRGAREGEVWRWEHHD
jgi:isopentenyl-diphosphate delta-isomerase